jgi:hypothetical protein
MFSNFNNLLEWIEIPSKQIINYKTYDTFDRVWQKRRQLKTSKIPFKQLSFLHNKFMDPSTTVLLPQFYYYF